MRKTRNLTEYREAWEHHIKEMATLALAANITYDNYTSVKTELMRWLDQAIENIVKQRIDHE